MPPTTTSTTAPSLPDELLEEVFLRLPPEEPALLARASFASKLWLRVPFSARPPPEEPALLARASFASKLWLGLLSGPRFRRRYGEFHGAPPMLGFLYSWPYLCMPDEEEPVANFVSTTKFAARAPDDHGYTPWDCRHGRVLLGNHYKYDMGLVVWDPMTGRRMKLEAPAHHWVAAVLCDVSDCDHRACHEGPFRAVFVGLDRIGHDDDDCVARARVYSPETDEWSEQCPDGSLGFAHVDRLTLLCLWSRQMGSDGVASWTERAIIDLKNLLPIQNPKIRLRVIGSVEGRDIIFVATDLGIYSMNLILAPVELTCAIRAFLHLWAGLQNDGDRKKLPEGPSALQQKAVRAHDAARAAPAGGLLRITEAGEEGLEI
uniref:F-box domain-containing protein n=1 Tax=Aegilops tauschii TaxID=37682 RepID=M8C7X9_AEGTA